MPGCRYLNLKPGNTYENPTLACVPEEKLETANRFIRTCKQLHFKGEGVHESFRKLVNIFCLYSIFFVCLLVWGVLFISTTELKCCLAIIMWMTLGPVICFWMTVWHLYHRIIRFRILWIWIVGCWWKDRWRIPGFRSNSVFFFELWIF